MNVLRNVALFGMVLLTVAVSFASGRPATAGHVASSASVNLVPAVCVTETGNRSGSVANLRVMDQTGVQDDPAKYVTFITLVNMYRGYCRFFLPKNVLQTTVATISVKVNYKGPAKTSQSWSWFVYDWTISKWIRVGDNETTVAGRWKLLTFNPAFPRRFIDVSTGEIRVRMFSNNASGSTKIDYESVSVGYNLTPTPTLTSIPYTTTPIRTPTITPTITKTPTPPCGGVFSQIRPECD